jgi:hypothetical protein
MVEPGFASGEVYAAGKNKGESNPRVKISE